IPSYQVMSRAGIFPRLGNLNTSVDDIGKKKGLYPSNITGSISYGRPRSRNSWAVSKICAPQSPRAPIPNSYQQRHCPFTKSLLYPCSEAVPSQVSQSNVAGTGSFAGYLVILTSNACHRLLPFIWAVIDVTSLIIPASFQALNWK